MCCRFSQRESKKKRQKERKEEESSLTWTDGWWMECDWASCTYTHTAWLSNGWELQLIKYGSECVKGNSDACVPLPPAAEIFPWQFVAQQCPVGWLLCSRQRLCWWATCPPTDTFPVICLNRALVHSLQMNANYSMQTIKIFRTSQNAQGHKTAILKRAQLCNISYLL